MTTSPIAAPPRSVVVAARWIVAYGLAVVVHAAIQQSLADWKYWRDFPRAFVRLGGAALVAYGLLRRSQWAWWIAAIAGGSFVVLGALGMVGITIGTLLNEEPVPVGYLGRSFVVFMILTIGLVYLFRRESRTAFRAPVSP